MSRDVVTGIRLLRAVMIAQRAHDVWIGRTGRDADAEWCRTRADLDAAQNALDAFIYGDEADFKRKQAGDQ